MTIRHVNTQRCHAIVSSPHVHMTRLHVNTQRRHAIVTSSHVHMTRLHVNSQRRHAIVTSPHAYMTIRHVNTQRRHAIVSSPHVHMTRLHVNTQRRRTIVTSPHAHVTRCHVNTQRPHAVPCSRINQTLACVCTRWAVWSYLSYNTLLYVKCSKHSLLKSIIIKYLNIQRNLFIWIIMIIMNGCNHRNHIFRHEENIFDRYCCNAYFRHKTENHVKYIEKEFKCFKRCIEPTEINKLSHCVFISHRATID